MLLFLCLIILLVPISSFFIHFNGNLCRNTITSSRNLYMQGGRRKRRTKVKKDGKITVKKSTVANSESTTPIVVDDINTNDKNIDEISEFDNLLSSSSPSMDTTSTSSFDSTSSSMPIQPQGPMEQSYQSKLKPLSGTAKDKQMKYQEKNFIERNLEELFAPTPAGQEPKVIQIAKTVTWGAVILLVLVEIGVSIKVGGAPFEISKVSVPDVTRMLKIK